MKILLCNYEMVAPYHSISLLISVLTGTVLVEVARDEGTLVATVEEGADSGGAIVAMEGTEEGTGTAEKMTEDGTGA